MKIICSRDAYLYLRKLMTADVEEFWAVALQVDNKVLRTVCLFRGTVDHCYAHPRDVFRLACVENAAAVLVAHNHPSQDPLPSVSDKRFTRQLIRIRNAPSSNGT